MSDVYPESPLTRQEEGVLDMLTGKVLEIAGYPYEDVVGRIPTPELRQIGAEMKIPDGKLADFHFLARNRARDLREGLEYDISNFEQGGTL